MAMSMPFRLLRRGFAVAMLAAVSLSAASFAQAQGAGQTHTIVIRQMQFNPAQVSVKPGETIEWKNEDIFAHSATANDGSFDSGLIAPGGSWSTVISGTGTVGYHCRPHPNMTASLVVSAEGANSATSGAPSLRFVPPRSPHEIHPILVNFTAALLPIALLSDVLGRMFRRQSLHDAAVWMMLYEAAITPLTVAAGWWWRSASAGALPARLILVHEWLGTAAAGLFIVLATWRWKMHKRAGVPSNAYLALTCVAMLALIYQGSIGGRMLFGR